MPSNVYVAWQNPQSRRWHTVARLTYESGHYDLKFTNGAAALEQTTKRLFNTSVSGNYRSESLISLFSNKIPPRGRSDFKRLSTWLNLQGGESEFELLSRFGLIQGTDGISVYPEPSIVDQVYSLEFFLHGIRHVTLKAGKEHLHGDVMKWCDQAEAGSRLLPMLDVQNLYDESAVALRAVDGTMIVGYVPRFYSADVRSILGDPALAKTAKFELIRNNQDAPEQMRLLCSFTSQVHQAFKPLDDDEHKIFPSLRVAV